MKDKAKAKAARRADKRDQPTSGTKGPQIDWSAAVHEHDSGFGVTPAPSTDDTTPPGGPNDNTNNNDSGGTP